MARSCRVPGANGGGGCEGRGAGGRVGAASASGLTPRGAQRPGWLSPQRTRRPSVHRVWRRGRHCACAGGWGARRRSPRPVLCRSPLPAGRLEFLGPRRPLSPIGWAVPGRRQRCPGRRGGPWRRLLPRERGAHARRGRGGGSRARCGGRAGSFSPPAPRPAPRPVPPNLPAGRPGARCLPPDPARPFRILLPGPPPFCSPFKTFPPGRPLTFVGFPGSPAGFALERTRTCHSFGFRIPPAPQSLPPKTPIHFLVSSPPASYLPKGLRHPAAFSAHPHLLPAGYPSL